MDDELLAWAPRQAEPAAGSISLPGYSDFRLVAQGGEGTVYRARQDGLGRDVAVKVLQVDDPATLARFQRELEITVRLGRQHPHIVTVLDTGTVPGGRPCIVMEFYDLGSLQDRLRERGPLPVVEVVAAGTAVADALAFAHAQGFLHRDVKPQNILVLPTSYVLADFGIARGADAGHSASLQMVSYRHAAPQMIDGAAPAAADDVWSLGSTLFSLLEGVPPFASDNPDEDTVLPYLGRIRSAEPRPLTRPDVPPELTAVITRCLRKDRADRFPDAAALRDALAEVGAEVRRWGPAPANPAKVSTVDADATAMAPVERTSHLVAGSFTDFGPTPTPPEAEPMPEPVRAPVVDESRGTMTGKLADLTVRQLEVPVVVDFGPSAGAPLEAGSSPQAQPRRTDPARARTVDSPPTPLTAATPMNSPAAPPMGAPATPLESPAAPPTGAAPTTRMDSPAALPTGAAPANPTNSPATLPTGAAPASLTNSATALPTGAAYAPPMTSPPTPSSGLPPVPVFPAGERTVRTSPVTAAPVDPGSQWPHARPVDDQPRDWDLLDFDATDRTPDESAPVRRSRAWAWGLAAVVVSIVGVGIGILAADDGSTAKPPPKTTEASVSTTVPPTTGPPSTSGGIAEGGNPNTAPVLNRLKDNGSTIEVFWTDPTKGQAHFVLYDVTAQSAKPKYVSGVDPGKTTFLVPDLDPKAKQYCFQLVAIGLVDPATNKGSSTRVCAVRN
ncbi:Probable serine/threonine-protein kinase pknK [Alloactinosynnema sp. L-07]|uniref:serine/threonine-protein kinase n=1 Tax=Alloactinosynnema sp. L-07 TaxID=1653480 RepID=UPI00065F0528|nr:serine/threonine-protein kinase [Alloactinosynnema sp. L-07]CRK55598.1 Probable serine/threonine-protein kinase pknK [Alloactinosynnema sp. L-07]